MGVFVNEDNNSPGGPSTRPPEAPLIVWFDLILPDETEADWFEDGSMKNARAGASDCRGKEKPACPARRSGDLLGIGDGRGAGDDCPIESETTRGANDELGRGA
jgi:hypothetical protein